MRFALLTLMLANLLLGAWQFWIEPEDPVGPGPGGLALFAESPVTPPPEAGLLAGTCLRVGPLPLKLEPQRESVRLGALGIDARPIAEDAPLWLGHWVQIGGFTDQPAAAAALQSLVAGGIADAYLMQDQGQSLISLGVFQERPRADRRADAIRALGFPAVRVRDRYRPSVESFLLIRLGPDQTLKPGDMSWADEQIIRPILAPCDAFWVPPLRAAPPTEALPPL